MTIDCFITNIAEWFTTAVKEVYPTIDQKFAPSFNDGMKYNHHLQFVVMSIAAYLKINVKTVAEEIIKHLKPHTAVECVTASSNGHICIHLAPAYLASCTLTKPICVSRKIVIDYPSPNVAKDMHIGHLRPMAIGDSLARILAYVGHEVIRINHIGDWGTQFGMLLAYIKRGSESADKLTNMDLSAIYRKAKEMADIDPVFNAQAHAEVVALQAGDTTNRALWEKIVKVSLSSLDLIFNKMWITPQPTVCGESFYNTMLNDVITDLTSRGIAIENDGALIVPVEGQKNPLILRKSDGGYGYDSTDLAALYYRTQHLGAQQIIYVVDAGQSNHFDAIFAAGTKAGWTDGCELTHAKFGLIHNETGKKFKTRSGDVERLEDVLSEAYDRAINAFETRNESDTNAIKQITAAVLGYGGIKYYELMHCRTSDYTFSYDKMLSLDGNTIAYIQYSHARLCGILRKAAQNSDDGTQIIITDSAESMLMFQVLRWTDAVATAARELAPHHICNHLYKTAIAVSNFTRDCKVLQSEPTVRASRLQIVRIVISMLNTGLDLLGIPVLERI